MPPHPPGGRSRRGGAGRGGRAPGTRPFASRPRLPTRTGIFPGRPYAGEAFIVWVVVFAAAVLALGLRPPGLAFDEPFYVDYGTVHLRWLLTLDRSSFTREGILRYWEVGSEHPPLFSLAIGFFHEVLGRERDALNLQAARSAGVVEYAFLAASVYLFTAARWGRWAGRLAALALAAQPRLFAHGQLAAGDLPMALTWFLAVWALVRALERPGMRREVLAGFAFGAALLTKMNALFLPIILVPWGLALHRRRALRPLAVMLGVGLAVFVAGWPWMWVDTFAHLRGYLQTGTERARILVYYLGRPWKDVEVPWHYPLVMSAVTVPVGVLAGCAAGAAGGFRRRGRRGLTALLSANVLVPLVLFGLPGVPAYDGVRLFLHVFPFVACLAGVGGVAGARWLRSRGASERWALGAVLAVALVQLVPTAGTVPFGLSYYNLLAGGPAGARRLGFETTYWGEGMDAVFWRRVEQALPGGSRLAINFIPAHRLRPFYDAPVRRAGLVPVPYRPGPGGRPAWDFLAVVWRQGYFDDEVRRLRREAKPIVERRLRFFGSVPLVRVYDMRRRRGAAGSGG